MSENTEPKKKRPPVLNITRRFLPLLAPHFGLLAGGILAAVVLVAVEKAPPLLMRYLIDSVLTPAVKSSWNPVIYHRALHGVLVVVMSLVGLHLCSSLFSFFRMYLLHVAGEKFVRDIRISLYNHLQRLSLSYFESRSTGDIMSRVSNDVNMMEELVTHASDSLITDTLNLGLTTVILLWLSWKLTLFALIPVPLLVFLIYLFATRVRPVYRGIRDRLGEINAKLQDNLSGIRVIKSFTREDFENEQFTQESNDYYDMSIKGIRLWTRFFPTINFIQATGVVLVLSYGSLLILRPNPELTIGSLFAFVLYVNQFYQPIGNLFRIYDTILRASSAGERIVEVLDTEPEVKDAPDALDLPSLQGWVKFDKVSFRYQTGEEVLTGIDLEARPGDLIALVGRSGAGKTSMINLLARFYDPTEGRIIVDGQDLRSVTQHSLRKQIAMVLQDTFLFNGSVKANLRYGKLEASDAELIEAARIANADEFIRQLPEGYDTQIGERGIKLSGGQRQRISIARAVLANPRILILDEATSMVDSESEQLIQKAMEALMKGRTTFVIAHRLSTVKHADKIVTLDEGRILEEGDHQTLIKQNGSYAAMVERQYRRDEEEYLN